MIFDDLRFLKRLSLWLLLPLLVVSILVGSAFTWLCGTENGARWALNLALSGRGSAEEIKGTLGSGLHIRKLRIESGSTRINIDSLDGDWQLSSVLGGQFSLERLTAKGVDLALAETQEPSSPMAWPSLTLPLPVEIKNFSIENLSVKRGDASYELKAVKLKAAVNPFQAFINRLSVENETGRIEVQGKLTTRYPYQHDLKILWQWLYAGEHYEGSLASRGNVKKMAIEHQLHAPYAISTEGRISLTPSATVTSDLADINVALANSWEENIPFFGDEWPAFAATTLDVEGNALDYRVSARGDMLGQGKLSSLGKSKLTIVGTGNLDGAQVSESQLSSERGNLTLQGEIQWTEGVRWQGNLSLENATLPELPELSAMVSAAAETRGTYDAGQLSMSLQLDKLSGTLGSYLISGKAVAGLSSGEKLTVDIDAAALNVGDNRLIASGTISDFLDLQWQLDATNLAQLYPNAGGKLFSHGILKGARSNPLIEGAIDGRDLKFQDWGARALEADFSGDGGSNRITATVNDLSGPGIAKLDLNLEALGGPENHDVSADAVQGDLRVTLGLSGHYGDKLWQGHLRKLTLENPYSPVWSLTSPAELSASADKTEIGKACLENGSGNLCAGGSFSKNYLKGMVDAKRLDLALLQAWLPAATTLTGTLSGNGQVSGQAKALSGDFKLESRDGELAFSASKDQAIRQPFDLTADGVWESGSVRVSGALNLPGNGAFDLFGRMGLAQRDIEGHIKGEVTSLAWLQALTTQLEDVEGRILTDVSFSGPLRGISAQGALEVADFSATLPAVGTALSPSAATIRFGDNQWQLNGELKSNGSALKIAGSGDLQGQSDEPATLHLAGEHFPLVDLPEYRAFISPDLDVTYKNRVVTVAGKLAIPEADIKLRPKPEGITEITADEVITPASEPRNGTVKVKANVDLTLGKKVRFEGYGLTTGLKGDLNLKRTTRGVPTARGTISLKDGTYEAYGQKLKVRQGILIFQGAFDNPGLNIIAERETSDALVGVEIGGTANDIRSSLFSNPSLPPTHTLSLLVTGKLPGNMSQTEGNQMANAAAALGISQSEWLTSQLQKELGVDVFALQGGDTYLDSSLVVGKYLSSKLFVSYVQNLFAPQGALAFEYQLGDRLGLRAESGEVQSLDLLYRIEH